MRCVSTLAILTGLGASTFSSVAATAATLLAINGQANTVVKLDTVSGATQNFLTNLPNLGGNDTPNGLAFDGTNAYFVSGGATTTPTLYRANSGGLSIINTSQSLGQVFSGTFASGSYYAWNEAGSLLSVDVGNGNVSTLLEPSAGVPGTDRDFGDIAVRGNVLYASFGAGSTNGETNGAFARVDLTTNSLLAPVSTGETLKRMQLAFAGSTLFGLVTATGNLYQVDQTTGATTFVRTVAAGIYPDLATVPLPAAVWLFGSAFLGLCWLGRRSGMRGVGMLPRS